MANYEVRKNNGTWKTYKEGSSRASSTGGTQAEQVNKAKKMSANSGGGEVRIKGENGRIRAQDTVQPGNDPRSRKG